MVKAKLTGVLDGDAEGLEVGEGVGQVTPSSLVQHPRKPEALVSQSTL